MNIQSLKKASFFVFFTNQQEGNFGFSTKMIEVISGDNGVNRL